jgi:hypothetical protein
VSDPKGIDRRAFAVEQARLGRFFETINKHRKALDEGFGGELDPAEWRAAFDSIEPRDANRTMVVTGDHSAVLNAYVEILKASAPVIRHLVYLEFECDFFAKREFLFDFQTGFFVSAAADAGF